MGGGEREGRDRGFDPGTGHVRLEKGHVRLEKGVVVVGRNGDPSSCPVRGENMPRPDEICVPSTFNDTEGKGIICSI